MRAVPNIRNVVGSGTAAEPVKLAVTLRIRNELEPEPSALAMAWKVGTSANVSTVAPVVVVKKLSAVVAALLSTLKNPASVD